MQKSMQCVVCGENMREVSERKRAKYRDEVVEVETALFRCGSCGEGMVTPQQMKTHVRAVKNEVRRKHGLLPPERIAQIRHKSKLTQNEMEEIFGTGPKVVVRWESGKVIQSRGHDNMLRLLEREPGVLESLKQIGKSRSREQKQYHKSTTSPDPVLLNR